jgi:hypothetical protein
MLSFISRFVVRGVVTGLVGAALTTAMAAQQWSSPPDFSSKKVGWLPIGGDFIEIAGETAQSRAQRPTFQMARELSIRTGSPISPIRT